MNLHCDIGFIRGWCSEPVATYFVQKRFTLCYSERSIAALDNFFVKIISLDSKLLL